ncbi:hypothetical protein FHS01_005356 [Longimicrobium terrae]|uniref:Uncharacterized protein n=2 Tax=Longimicrobium terrae TaxID=1639882 RepID=A0A841H762_9BACT|nr:hypothetical protein [Longimicrobium terrae]MBB4639289.1 hypothetical protein [Longimicrobium terrae]MBB6073529.1 hypothetical protein [Longimicrobium terrae]
MHSEITADSLKETDTRIAANRHRLETWIADGEFPVLFSFRYTHPDTRVGGREWVTEFGLEQASADSEIRCTLLLQVNDISPRVEAPIFVTQPRLIGQIYNRCPVSSQTVGQRQNRLSLTDSASFLENVNRLDRRHPIVVLSPLLEGGYLIPPAELSAALVGLGELYVIPDGEDTYELERRCGRENIAWRGAVNILRPPRNVRNDAVIRYRRLYAADLESLGSQVGPKKSEVLSEIVHSSNVAASRAHVSPLAVARVSESRDRKRELERRLHDSQRLGEESALLSFLQHAYNEHEEEIARLEAALDAAELTRAEQDDGLRALEYSNKSLTEALAGVHQRSRGIDYETDVRDALREVCGANPTPTQSLLALTALYPERVTILETGWKSAQESTSFNKGGEAFRLLRLLVTSYWDMLKSGGGDSGARSVFGSSFASTESETVKKNKRAKQLRTFLYEGEAVEMMAHLKIGVKDSVTETIRIHFLWDPERELIVIGHCGRHLDHR